MAGAKNTKGSSAPTSAPVGDVGKKINERNKEQGGGKDPLKPPIGTDAAPDGIPEEKKESGPCGLPKGCSIL